MNARLLIPLIAVTLFSLPAHALECSGGANGGMDATGNQCNDAAAIATAASFDVTAPPTAGPSKAETKQASSSSGGVSLKRTTATRHTSARSKSKQS